jgi:hypothetical protein
MIRLCCTVSIKIMNSNQSYLILSYRKISLEYLQKARQHEERVSYEGRSLETGPPKWEAGVAK